MSLSAGNDNFTYFADFYQPFLINESNVRGHLIRLGKTLNTILGRHNYPKPVSELLAEQIVLACMLSGSLKDDGALTFQVKGEGGLIKFMVVDVTATGEVRGYAELSDEGPLRMARAVKANEQLTLKELFGEKGYLVITMIQASSGQQYQGIVSLVGASLSEALSEYFMQSQQINASIQVAVSRVNDKNEKSDKGEWMAGGIMIQRLPSEGGTASDLVVMKSEAQLNEETEEWNRASILMNSVKWDELLDVNLPAQTLLYRLFNEDGVWVYEAKPIAVGCRCSRERIVQVLGTFSSEDLEDMKVDGVISVNCQFCNKSEVFGEQDVSALLQAKEQ